MGLATRHTKEKGDEAIILPCPVLTGFYQTFFRGVDRADAVGNGRGTCTSYRFHLLG